MNDLTNFILITIVFGVAVSVLSVLAERLLISNGFTRGNTIGLVIATFISSVIKQLIYPSGSLFLFGLLLVVIGVMAGNRSDLTHTMRKGKWWWKSENQNKTS